MTVRVLLVLVGIPSLIYSMIATFLREGREALWHTWNSTMMDLEDFKSAWRTKSLKREDW